MKLTSFFISETKQIYAKKLTVSESTFKIKAVLPYSVTSRNFVYVRSYLQTKTFAGNELVQYLQIYKYQDVNQVHLRKP